MGGREGTYEEEGEVEVGEGCPGEEELNGVVDELQRKNNLAEEVLARSPDPEPEYGGVDGCEEGAVQPATTLRDEFGDRCRYIGRSLGTLDIVQLPALLLLRDDFEAKDTILGEVHVALEKTSIA